MDNAVGKNHAQFIIPILRFRMICNKQVIFNESTKERINELEEQKAELKAALAAAKLKEDMGQLGVIINSVPDTSR